MGGSEWAFSACPFHPPQARRGGSWKDETITRRFDILLVLCLTEPHWSFTGRKSWNVLLGMDIHTALTNWGITDGGCYMIMWDERFRDTLGLYRTGRFAETVHF